MEEVVERVLATTRQRLAEQLTLDDLAKMAMFSKFHFARMFRSVTGLSPRRFIYALRLQEAKRLLVTTSLSVADVSIQVGYSSVGTFTSRFTASVGVPPAVYRRLRGNVSSVLRGEPPDPTAPGVISGRLEGLAEPEAAGPVLVGLLRRPMPEGRPARWEFIGQSADWSFTHVPAGRWHVLAVSLPPTGNDPSAAERHPTMMSVSETVKVTTENPAVHLPVRLRPIRPVDPPILFPLTGITGLAERRRRAQPSQPARAVANCHESWTGAVERRWSEEAVSDAVVS